MSSRPFVTSCDSTSDKPPMFERARDVVGAALGLAMLSPVLALAAWAVRLDSPGSAFFRAPRIGLAGRSFTMWKLRTMVADAAVRGPSVTRHDDPRITRVGRVLRRTRLDELPQLFNVLRGDMSLVGPRPEAPAFAALYPVEARAILRVRPGITGLAQLVFRHESRVLAGDDAEARYVREVLPTKLRVDLAYVQHASFGLDAWLLLLTALAVLGADDLVNRLVGTTLRRVGCGEVPVGT